MLIFLAKDQYPSSALARNPVVFFNSFLSSLYIQQLSNLTTTVETPLPFLSLCLSHFLLCSALSSFWLVESYSSFKTYCIFSKTLASFLSGVYPRPELHNTISRRPFPCLNFGVVYRFSCPSTGTEVLKSRPCSFLNAPQPQAQHSALCTQ